MIREIEKLDADSEAPFLPMRQLGVLHRGEICVEISRSAKPVSSLRDLDCRSTEHVGGIPPTRPELNPVSHPDCTNNAFGLGAPPESVCEGKQGVGDAGIAAAAPHDPA
jgi:hypothetical protein